jgi:hypothetical protein
MKSNHMRRLFVAATSQNDGKTSCSLGFVKGFEGLASSIGFMKPVGQRYITAEDQQVDEDAWLIRQACKMDCPLKLMNPIVIPQYFTRQYLEDPDNMHPRLVESIQCSFAELSAGKDLMVIEGTGHAGVGSVFDLSNARVAKLLDAKVVIVTLGGIGQPVDEVAVNLSLFEKENVQVIGVIANKVLPQKLEQTKYYLSRALDRLGLPLLGVIPNTPRLAWPTVDQIVESLHAQVLNGHDRLANPIANMMIGAMTPHNALTYVQDKTLLIVPGDRDDIVLAALTMDLLRKDITLAGIVFTGGLQPQPQTMDMVCRTDIPVLSVEARTYEATTLIHDMSVKIRVTDEEKIRLAVANLRENVELDELWHALL